MIGHNNPPENGRWNWYGEAEWLKIKDLK
jgi:hypothetical protein